MAWKLDHVAEEQGAGYRHEFGELHDEIAIYLYPGQYTCSVGTTGYVKLPETLETNPNHVNMYAFLEGFKTDTTREFITARCNFSGVLDVLLVDPALNGEDRKASIKRKLTYKFEQDYSDGDLISGKIILTQVVNCLWGVESPPSRTEIYYIPVIKYKNVHYTVAREFIDACSEVTTSIPIKEFYETLYPAEIPQQE